MSTAHTWQSYEQVATQIISDIAAELGLVRVEGKQLLPGVRSGREWEVDAKGVRLGDGTFVVIEMRAYSTSRLKAEDLAGLAYRIIDTGAAGGIVVSPLPLQEGASRVAAAEGIVSMRLPVNSAADQYILQLLNRIFARMPADGLTVSAQIISGSLEVVEDAEQDRGVCDQSRG